MTTLTREQRIELRQSQRAAEAKRRNRGRKPRIIRSADTIAVVQGREELGSMANVPNSVIGVGWYPDIDGSGVVDTSDLLWVIGKWGQDDGYGGLVGTAHLLAVISAWEASEPDPIGGDLIAPLVDQPAMNVLNASIHAEANCITRNNGGQCVINCDDFELISQNGYGIYADSSTRTILNKGVVESKHYYAIRGRHIDLRADDVTFRCPEHSVRLYGWREGYMRNCVIEGEYFRAGGGAADEWVNPMDTGGTPEAPIVVEGGRLSLTKQLTIYNATHDMVFAPASWQGTTKIFIDTGAKNITIGGPNKPYIDTKGQSAVQLAARGIKIV